MFLDTSAIVEYFITGPDYGRIVSSLTEPETAFSTFPTVIFEATTVLASRRNVRVEEAGKILEAFLQDLEVDVLPITRQTASAALDAFARYGKGRHPARLNFGDCFSYAGARQAGAALLYVGNDFAQTDLA